MTSIFTTKNNLETICLDKQKQAWLNMIIKLQEVYINDTIDENADPDNDVLLNLDQMGYINTKEANYINSISSNPGSVLQHPNGIFLLDISSNEANDIQRNFGVLCQSITNMDYTPLTQINKPTELTFGVHNLSWNGIISRYKKLPSNSALIVDAHMFENDRFDEKNNCFDSNHQDGLNNIDELLQAILPNTFNDAYHIGILLTDMDKAKLHLRSRSNLTNDRIAKAIHKLKRGLNRNYVIDIEVIFFDADDKNGYTLIHNRKIISNYFIITADYKLAALKKGRSLCDQSIVVWSLFENIDNDIDSDKKEKRIRIDLKKLQVYLKGVNPSALLYQNNRKLPDFSTLRHRLLNK